ncbi:MAG TPA: hypothetical protein PK244_08490, partial [Pseudomonadales bacterium]|nr:hypothetical protein [Pseudomonadales bacterium]
MTKIYQKKNMACRLNPLAVALLVAAFSTQGYAQTTAPVQPAAGDQEQKVSVAFDNADVKDVIRWASDLTTKNLIVHPGVAGKKITIVAGEPMTHEEAWQVFL